MSRRATSLHGVGRTVGIVEEVNGVAAPALPHQLPACIVVPVGGSVCNLLRSQAAGIVGKAQTGPALAGSRQLAAILPPESPSGTVVVAGGIANGIVGDTVG